MSNYTDFVLFVDALDDDENVATFNEWLKKEWASSQPQFKSAGVLGVFTVSINNASMGIYVLEQFRSIEWAGLNGAKMMIRLAGQEFWVIHDSRVIADS